MMDGWLTARKGSCWTPTQDGTKDRRSTFDKRQRSDGSSTACKPWPPADQPRRPSPNCERVIANSEQYERPRYSLDSEGFIEETSQANYLHQELAAITDDVIYNELQTSDINMGRWTAEDPSLRSVLRWLRARL